MAKENYSAELNRLLEYVEKKVVTEFPTMKINLNYLMLAILDQKDSMAYTLFKECLMDSKLEVLYNLFYQVVDQKSLRAVKPNRDIKYDEAFNKVLKNAEIEAKDVESEKITSIHVLMAILRDESEDNNIRNILLKVGLTYDLVFRSEKSKKEKDDVSDDDEGKKETKRKVTRELVGARVDGYDDAGTSGSSIKNYCVDISKMASKGKIDPLIGRRREMDNLIRVLGRRKKNNALLVGEGGCGKTILARSVACLIDSEEIPLFLRNKRVVSLDYTALISGTQFRGMLEERTKNLLTELKRGKNYILIIDDIDVIFGSRGGTDDFGIAAMFSNALEEGGIQVIGTCTQKGYRNVFEKDSSLDRRFQKVLIEPSSKDESIEIVKGIIGEYEEFHGVKFDEEAVVASVELADKYLTDRKLPDSAIDIIDETATAASIRLTDGKWSEVRKKLREVVKKIDRLKAEDKYDEADKLGATQERELRLELANIEKEHSISKDLIPVSVDDVVMTISIRTGIPVNKLTVDEKKRIGSMDERIKAEVIGQDEAVDRICKVIKRNRVGLRNDRNYGTLMLIGRSGVGKTLIAKKLAKEVFGDEKSIVRFDMSEYSDKTSVNKLIGSNPGYVGYDEGGLLTETVKNKKYCVLLIDEIEKADPEVYNIFLQVFDEGFLTDNRGVKVDFRNTIILMTSNVGAREASEFGKGVGFKTDVSSNEKRILTKELKKKFPPEFINRIDDIIYFNELTDDNYRTIIELEMRKMKIRALNANIDVEWGDDAIEYIFEKVREMKEYGARPIIRTIQDEYENIIADEILSGDIATDDGQAYKTYKIKFVEGKPNLVCSNCG